MEQHIIREVAMPGLTLKGVLEKPGRIFQWGDTVKGHVKVTLSHECSATALMAVLD